MTNTRAISRVSSFLLGSWLAAAGFAHAQPGAHPSVSPSGSAEPRASDAAPAESPAAEPSSAQPTPAASAVEMPPPATQVGAPIRVGPPPPPPVGAVLGHRGNDAIIDLGANHGLVLGSRIEIFAVTPVDLGDGETAYERDSLATGEITALTGRRALVRLGVNEDVPVGAQVVPVASEPSTSVAFPNRVGGFWEIAGTARVFAVNSALGGGFLGDASLTYRGERPFFVQARIDPSGFTVHRTSRNESFHNAAAMGGMVLAGIDHHYFGFGAGFGVTRAIPSRDSVCVSGSYPNYGTTCTETLSPAHAGFSFGIHARLGATDGLSVVVDTSFTTVRAKSEISLLDLRVQIPVTQKLAFTLRGGSGFLVSGASWVDIGARMRARGDGGAGSLYVTPFLGWARLTGSARTESYVTDYNTDSSDSGYAIAPRAGASAGVNVEYRR